LLLLGEVEIYRCCGKSGAEFHLASYARGAAE
jgi:hypothetical protein